MVVHSKENDSDYQDDSDTDSLLPITEEDMFNNLTGAQLPTRLRKAPHIHGTPPSPPTKMISKKKKKKNTKKPAPLVTSDCTNQSNSSNNNNNNNKKKKRSRRTSKSSAAPLPLIPSIEPVSFPASSAIRGNYSFVICICSLLMSYLLLGFNL
jgi:hypothetical protein